MSDTTLNHCPKCGGEIRLISSNNSKPGVYAQCRTCRTEFKVADLADLKFYNGYKFRQSTVRKMERLWNEGRYIAEDGFPAKGVLFSIQPRFCGNILRGEKTIELRKTKPNLPTPFKGLIYCTKPKYEWEDVLAYGAEKGNWRCMTAGGKIIGEFICNGISEYPFFENIQLPSIYGDGQLEDLGPGYMITMGELKATCLSVDELESYGAGKTLYGIEVSELNIFESPKPLSEYGLERASQSWCYYNREKGEIKT